MTAKKNFKKTNKDHKELSPKAKKAAMGTASVLLGATLMGSAKPIKKIVGGKRDDEIGLVVKAATMDEDSSVATEAKQKIYTSDENNGENGDVNTVPESTTEPVENVGGAAGNEEDASQQNKDEVNTQGTPQTEQSTETQDAGQTETVGNTATTDSTNSTEGTTDKTVADENVSNNPTEADQTTKEETTTAPVEETNQEPSLNEPPVEEKKEEKATLTHQEAADKVNQINADADKKLQDVLDSLKAELGENITITEEGEVIFNTTADNIEIDKGKLDKHIDEQIKRLNDALEEYKAKLVEYGVKYSEYKDRLNKYNAAIEELKKLELWSEGSVDLNEIKQELILGELEEETKVEATKPNGDSVDLRYDVDKLKFLNQFFEINGPLKDEFLKLTYTGFKNSFYGGKAIDKVELVFSDWVPETSNFNKLQGIYFGDKLANGFYYADCKGVTMSMKLYADGKLITLDPKAAYIVINSLNSEAGTNDKYIEKAEIINGEGHGGKGHHVPGSSVSVHENKGVYGGDILYSSKNNEVLATEGHDLSNKELALNTWNQAIIDKFWNWDSSTDRSKEYFGSGLFQVWGNEIKIRFSNDLGSAWVTYTTVLPKLINEGNPGKEPELPKYGGSYAPGKLVLVSTPDQPTQPTQPTDPQPTTPVDPEPTDPLPTQPTDPQPTQPTPVIPKEEDFTRPLPEEEPGSEYPDQAEEEETGEKRVTPHASDILNASTSGDATLATAGSDKQAATGTETPETVSTETTEVIEKTQNEETLPETGEHDKNEVATLLASLAAALGITGLAGTSKRKKKDE